MRGRINFVAMNDNNHLEFLMMVRLAGVLNFNSENVDCLWNSVSAETGTEALSLRYTHADDLL